MMRTANPALNDAVFRQYTAARTESVMTIQGTVNRTAILVLILIATAAPKFMEWYAAFGLMVTLVWLYLEILRLLAKTRRN